MKILQTFLHLKVVAYWSVLNLHGLTSQFLQYHFCSKALNWIQNSVFEGEITEVKLREMLVTAKQIMNEETDSIILFKSREERWLDKEIIGVERMTTDNFI